MSEAAPHPQREALDKLYEKHTSLPSDVPKNTLPPYLGSRVWRWVWDTVFPWVGFPFVRMSTIMEADHTYYCIEFIVFGVCTHRVWLTPYSAYMVGTAISMLSVYNKRHPFILFSHNGLLYVPAWASSTLLNKLVEVCRTNDTFLKGVMKEVNKLLNKQESATN